MLKIFLIVFVISMIPLIELRGAIPVGVALVSSFLGLGEESLSVKYIVLINLFSMLGNMLPVPFIYFFARKFLEWGSSKKYIGKMCNFFLVKGKKVDIPSYQVKPGTVIEVKETSKNLKVINEALEASLATVAFVEVDKDAKKGTYVRVPERNELFTAQEINELLVVEFYNR